MDTENRIFSENSLMWVDPASGEPRISDGIPMLTAELTSVDRKLYSAVFNALPFTATLEPLEEYPNSMDSGVIGGNQIYVYQVTVDARFGLKVLIEYLEARLYSPNRLEELLEEWRRQLASYPKPKHNLRSSRAHVLPGPGDERYEP